VYLRSAVVRILISTPDHGFCQSNSPLTAQYRAMILLASWCALRFGELTELRLRDVVLDVDAETGVIRVECAVVRVGDGFQVTTPKSEAGTRDVAIPPHLLPVLAEHLSKHVGPDRDALLFPAAHGGHLAPATLYRQFYKARDAADRPDLRFHDLRHSGAVLAAATGATLAKLMQRLGHSTPAAAMRYQHRRRDARPGHRGGVVEDRAGRVGSSPLRAPARQSTDVDLHQAAARHAGSSHGRAPRGQGVARGTRPGGRCTHDLWHD
jgi:integrase